MSTPEHVAHPLLTLSVGVAEVRGVPQQTDHEKRASTQGVFATVGTAKTIYLLDSDPARAGAAWAGSFWLLCVGTLFSGMYNAFGQYYRFVATEAWLRSR